MTDTPPDHANEAGDEEEEEEDAAEDGDTPPVGIWRWVSVSD